MADRKTLSEERGQKAAEWVEKEVDKLVGEILSLGKSTGDKVEVTFGVLFARYADVSDTLVGILARAKKRDLLQYEGQGGHLLFQGKHDHVVITLNVSKSVQWRKEYATQSSSTKPQAAVTHIKKDLTVMEQYEMEKKAKAKPSVDTLHRHGHHITHHPAAVTKPAAAPAAAVVVSKPVAKPAPVTVKPVAKPAPMATVKPVAKPAPVAAVKPVAKPAPVAAVKPVAKPAPVTAVNAVAKPAPVAAVKPGTKPAPVTTKPAATAKPVSRPVSVKQQPVASVTAAAKPNVILKPNSIVQPRPASTAWKPVNTSTTSRPNSFTAGPAALTAANKTKPGNAEQTNRIMQLLN